ncbi:MAG: type II toxin-antitoxin system prevent-host-death family antitoxin [Actinomycetia bacterium]|nr:type II toxin-antitoxin system prevent-host-death family antitoxin [Actinomycetes bacterium]
MVITVNTQDAKTQLSRLLVLMQAGNEVIIANRGKPIARLEPIDRPKIRNLGFVDLPAIPDNFFEPWDDGDLSNWDY